ncbi:PREDICTED: uncharacterized protein LOC105576708 [Cercocebus atys]|uniref:uncharacterized protein LOC105576708 n=1 Tax=Cercocebus atys TaxID=9531 RepID=UPI0005F57B2F|nr:PREDICTED: uncharacterized protein LOC105576708 [Cercocebus atys]
MQCQGAFPYSPGPESTAVLFQESHNPDSAPARTRNSCPAGLHFTAAARGGVTGDPSPRSELRAADLKTRAGFHRIPVLSYTRDPRPCWAVSLSFPDPAVAPKVYEEKIACVLQWERRKNKEICNWSWTLYLACGPTLPTSDWSSAPGVHFHWSMGTYKARINTWLGQETTRAVHSWDFSLPCHLLGPLAPLRAARLCSQASWIQLPAWVSPALSLLVPQFPHL